MRRGFAHGLALAAPLALLAGPVSAEVQIALREGKVDLSAHSAPLNEVLDRLARQTHMEITYEGAPPRQLVTATVQAATPAQTVLSVLEGLGVNYALQLDATGQQVLTLLMIAPKTGAAPARPAVAEGAVPRLTPAPPDDDEPAIVDEDEPVPTEGRPERPNRFRPGRDPMERPGAFDPAAPSQAQPVVPAMPAPAYPVSPFAPTAPPVQQIAPPAVTAPNVPPPPAPDEN
jgi:hypothetical protein